MTRKRRRKPIAAPGVNPLRNIQRHDHNYFHGWLVCVTRHGRSRQRSFSDSVHGPAVSLAKALEWRNDVEAHLPPPVKLKRTFSLNTSGIIGVTRSSEKTRSGSVLERWIATFPVVGRKRMSKRSFSVARYGEAVARAKAIEVRQKAVDEYIAARAAMRDKGQRG